MVWLVKYGGEGSDSVMVWFDVSDSVVVMLMIVWW